MIINGERALAYTARCGIIEPIEGADNIDLMQVNGWRVIVKKGEFKEGDLCVYFEIDSKVPEAEWSEFLASKHYRIRTMKLGKFKVVSQGLALPLNVFNVVIPNEEGVDVTELLGVTYYVGEDNTRKAKSTKNMKYNSMAARHKDLFKKQPYRWLMHRQWGRELLFFFFGKKKDNPRSFPSFVSKTDEERIENQPFRLKDGNTYVVSEKLDGTSCTYALKRTRKRFGKDKYEFFVCSRNVRQADENQDCYHDHNIYWDLAFKYNIESVLHEILNTIDGAEWVCIQGEGVGSVQGNPLKLDEDDLYCFNFIDSVHGRWDSYRGRELVGLYGLKWVPLIGEITMNFDSMEEFKATADGKSVVNPKVLREGYVYRSLDGKDSFKNVSNKFLLKKGQ